MDIKHSYIKNKILNIHTFMIGVLTCYITAPLDLNFTKLTFFYNKFYFNSLWSVDISNLSILTYKVVYKYNFGISRELLKHLWETAMREICSL